MRPIALFMLTTAAILTLLAPAAWFVILTDGLYVLVLAIAAAGWGAWPAAWLLHGRSEIARAAESAPEPGGPRGERLLKEVVVAAGIGFAFLSPTVLAIGAAGLLSQAVAWGLIGAGIALGGHRLIACATRTRRRKERGAQPRAERRRGDDRGASGGAGISPSGLDQLLRHVAAFSLAPVAAVLLYGASLPPGILWPEEAGGYDALEYHLQAPREYYDAGRIHFLPHNVYASFPQQMEMLYLLLMHLTGDLNAAAIAAQLLHALFGVLTVLAVAAFSPGGRGAPAAMLAAASATWLAYLGCLAYVELGMIFFAALAAGLLLDRLEAAAGEKDRSETGPPGEKDRPGTGPPGEKDRSETGPPGEKDRSETGPPGGTVIRGTGLRPVLPELRGTGLRPVLPELRGTGLRPVFLAGLMAGAAAGCKYTAAAMVAAGLGAAWLAAMRGTALTRLRALALFAVGATATFSPWLIRNAAFTGNPVYPFAYEWFGGEAWSAEQAEQWEAGHEYRAGGEELPASEGLSADGPAPLRSRLGWGAIPRTKAALHELFASGMFGMPLFAAALVGALAGGRRALALGLWIVLMLAIWVAVTHVPGRFAVPIIVPLALLAGGSARLRSKWPAVIVIGIGAVGVLLAGWRLHAKLVEVDRHWAGQLHLLPGMADAMADEWNYVNSATPPGSYVWLMGEARAFYVRDRRYHYTVAFNRDPWIAAAEAGATPDELVAWLRRERVTHVVFNWPEIERLRRTYGFSPVVTRDWAARLAERGLTPAAGDALPNGVDVYIVSPPR